ncbi:MAG: hypothetical protein ACI8S6_000656 [Myxococcota bacterium]|jgi:hypothetical protein
MQSALHSYQMTMFGINDRGPDPLNILSLKHTRCAPLPHGHDYVRGPVEDALQNEHPCTMLVQADIATVLPKRLRSARALWRIIARLSATALDRFTIKLSPLTNASGQTGWDMVALQDTTDPSEDVVYFQLRLTQDGLSEAVLALANEILETLDAYGRLYLLPSPSGTSGQRRVVAYLTEGEIDRLELSGISADLL